MDNKPKLEQIASAHLELWDEGNVRKSGSLVNIRDLALNIKKNGMRVPLLVKEVVPKKRYLVFSGQRRLEAAEMISLRTVPCFVFKKISLREAQILSLSENMFREGMTIDDLSNAADQLIHAFKDIAHVATALGVTEQTVKGYLDYKAIFPELRAMVGTSKGKISVQQAKDIYVKYHDVKKAVRIAKMLAKISDRKKKKKYHESIRASSSSDDVRSIAIRAEKRLKMKEFEVLLPDTKYKLIEKIAYARKIDAEDLLVNIIEEWVSEYERGGHRT